MTTPTSPIIPLLRPADRAAKLAVLRLAEDQILGAVKIRMRLRQELGMAEDRLTTAEVLRLLTGGEGTSIDIGPLTMAADPVHPDIPFGTPPIIVGDTTHNAKACGCDPAVDHVCLACQQRERDGK